MELFTWIFLGGTWIAVACTGIWLVRTAKNLARITEHNDFMATLLDVAAERMQHAEHGLDLMITWADQGEESE